MTDVPNFDRVSARLFGIFPELNVDKVDDFSCTDISRPKNNHESIGSSHIYDIAVPSLTTERQKGISNCLKAGDHTSPEALMTSKAKRQAIRRLIHLRQTEAERQDQSQGYHIEQQTALYDHVTSPPSNTSYLFPSSSSMGGDQNGIQTLYQYNQLINHSTITNDRTTLSPSSETCSHFFSNPSPTPVPSHTTLRNDEVIHDPILEYFHPSTHQPHTSQHLLDTIMIRHQWNELITQTQLRPAAVTPFAMAALPNLIQDLEHSFRSHRVGKKMIKPAHAVLPEVASHHHHHGNGANSNNTGLTTLSAASSTNDNDTKDDRSQDGADISAAPIPLPALIPLADPVHTTFQPCDTPEDAIASINLHNYHSSHPPLQTDSAVNPPVKELPWQFDPHSALPTPQNSEFNQDLATVLKTAPDLMMILKDSLSGPFFELFTDYPPLDALLSGQKPSYHESSKGTSSVSTSSPRVSRCLLGLIFFLHHLQQSQYLTDFITPQEDGCGLKPPQSAFCSIDDQAGDSGGSIPASLLPSPSNPYYTYQRTSLVYDDRTRPPGLVTSTPLPHVMSSVDRLKMEGQALQQIGNHRHHLHHMVAIATGMDDISRKKRLRSASIMHHNDQNQGHKAMSCRHLTDGDMYRQEQGRAKRIRLGSVEKAKESGRTTTQTDSLHPPTPPHYIINCIPLLSLLDISTIQHACTFQRNLSAWHSLLRRRTCTANVADMSKKKPLQLLLSSSSEGDQHQFEQDDVRCFDTLASLLNTITPNPSNGITTAAPPEKNIDVESTSMDDESSTGTSPGVGDARLHFIEQCRDSTQHYIQLLQSSLDSPLQKRLDPSRQSQNNDDIPLFRSFEHFYTVDLPTMEGLYPFSILLNRIASPILQSAIQQYNNIIALTEMLHSKGIPPSQDQQYGTALSSELRQASDDFVIRCTTIGMLQMIHVAFAVIAYYSTFYRDIVLQPSHEHPTSTVLIKEMMISHINSIVDVIKQLSQLSLQASSQSSSPSLLETNSHVVEHMESDKSTSDADPLHDSPDHSHLTSSFPYTPLTTSLPSLFTHRQALSWFDINAETLRRLLHFYPEMIDLVHTACDVFSTDHDRSQSSRRFNSTVGSRSIAAILNHIIMHENHTRSKHTSELFATVLPSWAQNQHIGDDSSVRNSTALSESHASTSGANSFTNDNAAHSTPLSDSVETHTPSLDRDYPQLAALLRDTQPELYLLLRSEQQYTPVPQQEGLLRHMLLELDYPHARRYFQPFVELAQHQYKPLYLSPREAFHPASTTTTDLSTESATSPVTIDQNTHYTAPVPSSSTLDEPLHLNVHNKPYYFIDDKHRIRSLSWLPTKSSTIKVYHSLVKRRRRQYYKAKKLAVIRAQLESNHQRWVTACEKQVAEALFQKLHRVHQEQGSQQQPAPGGGRSRVKSIALKEYDAALLQNYTTFTSSIDEEVSSTSANRVISPGKSTPHVPTPSAKTSMNIITPVSTSTSIVHTNVATTLQAKLSGAADIPPTPLFSMIPGWTPYIGMQKEVDRLYKQTHQDEESLQQKQKSSPEHTQQQHQSISGSSLEEHSPRHVSQAMPGAQLVGDASRGSGNIHQSIASTQTSISSNDAIGVPSTAHTASKPRASATAKPRPSAKPKPSASSHGNMSDEPNNIGDSKATSTLSSSSPPQLSLMIDGENAGQNGQQGSADPSIPSDSSEDGPNEPDPLRFEKGKCDYIPQIIIDPYERETRFINISNNHVFNPLHEQFLTNLHTIWSPSDQQLFFARFRRTPKEFGKIANYFPNKTSAECSAWYYYSKQVYDYKGTINWAATHGRSRRGGSQIKSSQISDALIVSPDEIGHLMYNRYSGQLQRPSQAALRIKQASTGTHQHTQISNTVISSSLAIMAPLVSNGTSIGSLIAEDQKPLLQAVGVLSSFLRGTTPIPMIRRLPSLTKSLSQPGMLVTSTPQSSNSTVIPTAVPSPHPLLQTLLEYLVKGHHSPGIVYRSQPMSQFASPYLPHPDPAESAVHTSVSSYCAFPQPHSAAGGSSIALLSEASAIEPVLHPSVQRAAWLYDKHQQSHQIWPREGYIATNQEMMMDAMQRYDHLQRHSKLVQDRWMSKVKRKVHRQQKMPVITLADHLQHEPNDTSSLDNLIFHPTNATTAGARFTTMLTQNSTHYSHKDNDSSMTDHD